VSTPSKAAQNPFGSIVLLILFAVIAAAALGLLNQTTQEQIATNKTLHARALVTETLPGIDYDNDPALNFTVLWDPELSGDTSGLPAYRATNNGEYVATALTVVAQEGYVGPIRLLVGIDNRGRILRVRVIEHRETPGLGDKIEPRNSAWISIFDGKTADTKEDWRLKTDGGNLDQISGATITSRAVIRAVHIALERYAVHSSRLRLDPSSPEAQQAAMEEMQFNYEENLKEQR
jgi:electron transport complex protein RnfG